LVQEVTISIMADSSTPQPAGRPDDGTTSAGLWTVACENAAGVANLAVSINDEYRIVLRSPSGEFAVMGWQAGETLRVHLASAVSAILRGERR
jgi:hypothetical protein